MENDIKKQVRENCKKFLLPFIKLKNYNELDFPTLNYAFKFKYYTLFISPLKKQFAVYGVGFEEKIIQTSSEFNIYYVGTLQDCKIFYKKAIVKRLQKMETGESIQNELHFTI